MKMVMRLLAVAIPLAVVGCSSDVEEGEHVWKEQTQTIDKAKQVEQTIQQGLSQQMQQVDRK